MRSNSLSQNAFPKGLRGASLSVGVQPAKFIRRSRVHTVRRNSPAASRNSSSQAIAPYRHDYRESSVCSCQRLSPHSNMSPSVGSAAHRRSKRTETAAVAAAAAPKTAASTAARTTMLTSICRSASAHTITIPPSPSPSGGLHFEVPEAEHEKLHS